MTQRRSGDAGVTHRRAGVRRRVVLSAVRDAAAAIGPISAGDEIVGITNGQFSLIDIIEHVLDCIGPADVVVSTWTSGIYDQERAARFYADGRIRRIRWLLDPSMFARRPELAGTMLEAFGRDAFRAVNTHAKFCLLHNEERHIVVRSSMNLNPNRRLENFDISDDAALLRWFLSLVDKLWAEAPAGVGGTQSEDVFDDILRRAAGETGLPRPGRRVAQDGPLSPALLSFLAG